MEPKIMRMLFILLVLLITSVSAPAVPVRAPHIEAELVPERSALLPGKKNTVALRLEMEPHWHVYWRNPGDSGEPVKIAWALPAGFTAGPILWPAPRRIEMPPLANYGYEPEVFLLTEIAVPAGASGRVKLEAEARWLVCREECLPGKAKLTLDLPVAKSSAPSPWGERIAYSRRSLPQPSAAKATIEETPDSLRLTVRGAKGQLYFPFSEDLVRNGEPQMLDSDAEGVRITLAKSERFKPGVTPLDGILVAAGDPPTSTELHPTLEGGGAGFLWAAASAVLGAFLGGLILNLMPCVFPVLCLKVIRLGELSGMDAPARRRESLAYLGGVLAAFWVLAGALLALRAGGESLGWGFQLQSPRFLVFLVFLLFGMALNLAGLFEIEGRWTGMGQGLAGREGLTGSFFTGALAVVVATPCTAPFMGTALAFALARPAGFALAIFTALGLGLALPYVALAYLPRAARFLPRPGSWMVTLRELMAFPLFATSLWLLYVLGLETSLETVMATSGALLGLGFALWIFGRKTIAARLATPLSCLVAGGAFLVALGAVGGSAVATEHDGWVPFTPERLEAERKARHPVFLDFTAAWCITCKVNERLVLNTASVRELFERAGVTLMQGDWTNRSEVISRQLEVYGRNSVPVYVLYDGEGGAPVILPQILTAEIVREALGRLKTR
jgi:thiol:disulfide interchange protein DsbD